MRCAEEGRIWDDFNKPYLMHNKYTLALTVIIGKAGRIRDEGNKKISRGGNCAKGEVPEINLNRSATASKAKWEKSIDRIKEGNWFIYSNRSKNEEGRVRSGWILYGGKIQGKKYLGKLATVWDGEIKVIAEELIA